MTESAGATMPDLLRIPGDLFPDLLTGWCGPVEWRAVKDGPWRRGVWGYIGESSGNPVWGLATAGDGHDRGYDYRLPLLRPEVADHVARVLARRGTPVWPLVDAERTGALTREQVAAAIGWSALSVARGGGVLLGMIRIRRFHSGWFGDGGYMVVDGGTIGNPRRRIGWTLGRIAKGPETGLEGRACADRAALTAGFALLADDGTITFPEVPDAR